MGLLEDRRAQHKARETNRNWGLALSGRSPIVAPMYGDRQAGREQPAITVEPPDGRHLVVDVASQTWDGRLDLGGTVVRDEGWSSQSPVTGATDEAVAPTTSTYDLHVDLDTDEVEDVTVSVEVDGVEVGSTTLDLHGRLMLDLPVGTIERGQALTILTDKPVAVSEGLVGVQTIEPSVGRVADEPAPAPETFSTADAADGVATTDTTHTVTVPAATDPGDLLMVMVSCASWGFDGGAPVNIEGVSGLSGLTALTDSKRRSERVHGAAWWKIAESGDAGTTVTTTVSGGQDNRKGFQTRIYRVPGDWSSVHNHVFHEQDGTSPPTISGDRTLSATDLLFHIAVRYPSATGDGEAFYPADDVAVQHTEDTNYSSNGACGSFASLLSQGDDQPVSSLSGASDYSFWFWRLAVS